MIVVFMFNGTSHSIYHVFNIFKFSFALVQRQAKIPLGQRRDKTPLGQRPEEIILGQS